MKEISIKVTGMSCQHCVTAVIVELKKLPLESFDVTIGTVTAKYDELKTSQKHIEGAIREAGYEMAQ